MDLTAFTPGTALAGGALIGLAASVLQVVNGRTAGISGILAGLARPVRGDVLWRALFVLALLAVGAVAAWSSPASLGASPRSLGALTLAGLLVGVGTRLSGGCTSGHGVCGISRGSLRSIVATLTFVAAGVLTVTAMRVFGGAP